MRFECGEATRDPAAKAGNVTETCDDKSSAESPAGGWLIRQALGRQGYLAALLIGVALVVCVSGIILAGRQKSAYRLGQYVAAPVHARIDFAYFDRNKFLAAQQRARDLEPRVYRPTLFAWSTLREQMRQWPELAAGNAPGDLPEPMRSTLDRAALALLVQYQSPERKALFEHRIDAFFEVLGKLVVVPKEQRDQEIARHTQWRAPSGFALRIQHGPNAGPGTLLPLDRIYTIQSGGSLNAEIARVANECFRDDLAPQVAQFVVAAIQPTHTVNENATLEAQERAAAFVPREEGEIFHKAGVIIKNVGSIDERDLELLHAEHEAYRRSLGTLVLIRDALGILGAVAVVVWMLAWYTLKYQPRIVHNTTRAMALGLLLTGMLLVSQLASSGTRPLYIFAVTPTIVAAMILAIAYDARFSLGASIALALLTTLGLNQSMAFLLVPLAGACATCALIGALRTRGRLIEIGIAASLAMVTTTLFTGIWAENGAQPLRHILSDSLHASIAGVSAGFIVLGVLPFIERIFRITTGMTLLELCDASHPLQRKLATETPGTYSHSLQVAALCEAAAEAIGADALLARVGALYHDIGKTRRAGYFCENQGSVSDSAHLSLSPNVSSMIITGHIKDGIELAKQYNLPTILHPFIQQHHGTMLVEYFYHQARQKNGEQGGVEEDAYRYPGPKPRTPETAILMMADACESAVRAMSEPTVSEIEKLVHQLVLKRMLDGQFTECSLTLHQISIIERTLVQRLQSMHHSRIAYPQGQSETGPATLNPTGTTGT